MVDSKVAAITIVLSVLVITSVSLIPSARNSYAAAQIYTTPISIECDFISGKGIVKYELLKNGKLLGTAELDCTGTFAVERSAISTTVKPVDWKMTLKIEDANGQVVASKTASGRGLDASASLSVNGQYVFGKMGNIVR